MRKFLLCFLFLAIISVFNLYAADKIDDIMNTVRSRNESGVSSASLQTKVASYLTSFNSTTGEFNDIDYTSTATTNWAPVTHLDRIAIFALAYTKSGNSYYQDTNLYNNIIQALEFWNAAHPTSTNWWNIKILVPKTLGVILIQMRYGQNKVSADLENRLMAQMEADYTVGPNTLENQEGANLTDLATGFFYRACLRKDEIALNSALENAFKPLTIASVGQEGIQYDNSYTQHGPQLYIGGYSEELIKGIINFALNVAGTEYALGGEKLATLSNYVRNTYLKALRGQYIHYNAMGRSVSRNGATLKQSFATNINHMATIDPANAAEYNLAVKRMRGTESASSGIQPINILYPISDYVLHIRPEYTFSVRTVSDRTAYIERGNGENLKSYFMTFGSTALTCSGDEYTNIFPAWNWTRIPGTTNMQIATIPQRAQWGVKGISKFVGGASDSLYAVTTYMHKDVTNGSTTSANKSWFFFDDEIVCLGSGITTDYTGGITTSIEQSLKKGDITVSNGDVETVLSEGLVQYKDNISWIHHNNVGYFFPKGGDVRIDNGSKTGSWNEINTTQSTGDITKDVFSTFFYHGATPQNESYAYIIVPNKKTPVEVAAYNTENIEILENNASMQVVHHKTLDIWQMVFFEAGTFTSQELSVSVDKACVLMLKDIKTPKAIMHIADPAQSKSVITVKTKVSSISSEWVETICNFAGLSDEEAGFTKKYIIKGPKPTLYTRESGLTADTYVQGGSSADLNYGSVDNILIKKGTGAYDRAGYIKMSLQDMTNLTNPRKEEVGKVELALVITYTNSTADQVDWILNPIDDITWNEGELTYANKPTNSEDVVAAVKGRLKQSTIADNTVCFNITEYAKAQLAEGKTNIAFRLYNADVTVGSHDTKFATKEHANTAMQPRVITSIVERDPAPEYSITVPSLTGATINLPEGGESIIEGDKLSFSLVLDTLYSGSKPIVKANDIELPHISIDEDGLTYRYEIATVTRNIVLSVEGLKKNPVVLYTRQSVITGDTYVQNGAANQDKNFGSAVDMLIKMDGVGYNREGFVKMSLADMDNLVDPTKEEVGKVELSLVTTYTNAGADQVLWVLNPIEDTEWNEMQVTAANKPVHQEVVVSSLQGALKGSVANDRFYFDITEYAKEQYAKGKTDISFRIYNDTKAPDNKHDAKFGSKENVAAKHPMIITTIIEKAPAVEYLVNIPALTGAAFDWPIGDQSVEEGTKFNFSLTLDADYSTSVPAVTANGVELKHISVDTDGITYRYEIAKVEEDINISVTGLVMHNYRLTSLFINGEEHDVNEAYIVPCNQNIQQLTIEFKAAEDVYLDVDKVLKIDVSSPSKQEVKFKVGASANDIKKEYSLIIKKKFDFEDIIVQKYNSRLIVNNNKDTNGGYTFRKYYWIVDGNETEGTQIYSSTDEKLSTISEYSARLITTNNEELDVCPSTLNLDGEIVINVYPNPVYTGQVINIEANLEGEFESMKADIYSITGSLVKSYKLNNLNSQIIAPSVKGMYVLYIYNGKIKREFKLQVN